MRDTNTHRRMNPGKTNICQPRREAVRQQRCCTFVSECQRPSDQRHLWLLSMPPRLWCLLWEHHQTNKVGMSSPVPLATWTNHRGGRGGGGCGGTAPILLEVQPSFPSKLTKCSSVPLTHIVTLPQHNSQI